MISGSHPEHTHTVELHIPPFRSVMTIASQEDIAKEMVEVSNTEFIKELGKNENNISYFTHNLLADNLFLISLKDICSQQGPCMHKKQMKKIIVFTTRKAI